MNRILLVTPDRDESEWLSDELSSFGKITRTIDSLNFFIPIWNSVEVNIVIFMESAIQGEEAFFSTIKKVKSERPETQIMFIHHRDEDALISDLQNERIICLHYKDLGPGVVEDLFWQRQDSDTEAPAATEDATDTVTEFHGQEVMISAAVPKGIKVDKVKGSNGPDNHIDNNRRSKGMESDAYSHRLKLEEIVGKYVKTENQSEMMDAVEQIIKEETKKPKIIKKIEKVTEVVEVERYKVFPNKFIVVGSLYPSAGSTFTSIALTRVLNFLGVMSALVESPINTPELYHLLDGSRTAPSEYQFVTDQIMRDGRILKREYEWTDGNTTWYPSNPSMSKHTDWKYEHTYKLVSSIKNPIVIYDVSHYWGHQSVEEICCDADDIIFVVDPLPSKFGRPDTARNTAILKQLRDTGKSIYLIGNRNIPTRNKHKKEWIDSLSSLPEGIPMCFLPNIPFQEVIEAIWEGRLVQDHPEYLSQLVAACYPMLKKMVPASYPLQHLKNKKQSLFSRLFRTGD